MAAVKLPVSTRRKRVTTTGKFAPVTQDRILTYLIESSEDTIMVDDSAKDVHTTPKSVRDKGIIVCSECGHYNSDSLSECKFCHDKLIYIPSQI